MMMMVTRYYFTSASIIYSADSKGPYSRLSSAYTTPAPRSCPDVIINCRKRLEVF